MHMTHSPQADAVSVWLAPPGVTSAGTREIAPNVYADFDAQARFLGIEVLSASYLFDRGSSSSYLGRVMRGADVRPDHRSHIPSHRHTTKGECRV